MATDRSRDRKFDPGLDTPKDNEPGAGFPVPGSPVWEDAQSRETAIGATPTQPAEKTSLTEGVKTSAQASQSTKSTKANDGK